MENPSVRRQYLGPTQFYQQVFDDDDDEHDNRERTLRRSRAHKDQDERQGPPKASVEKDDT